MLKQISKGLCFLLLTNAVSIEDIAFYSDYTEGEEQKEISFEPSKSVA
jgi:hypothetical protein